MQVKLTSVTKGIDGRTGEELIVHHARVSNPKNQDNDETSSKLIKFLIEKKHWSPFEMSNMCVEIKTSRAIAQQILRHRSFSFQEFSQRYAVVENMEEVQLRLQAEKNRQSSFDELNKESVGWEIVEASIAQSKEAYKELLNLGVAKECARMVLPITTESTMYMNGTVRSWVHYLIIRCEPAVQLEHRQVALKIKSIFIEQFPSISEALGWTAS